MGGGERYSPLGDGRDDLVAGGREEYGFHGTPEDRLAKTTLHVFASGEDGRLTPAPELVEGSLADWKTSRMVAH